MHRTDATDVKLLSDKLKWNIEFRCKFDKNITMQYYTIMAQS